MKGFVFYTDRVVPDNAAGCAFGPFIFIRPAYKNDAGLLAHEQVHVAQFFRTFGLLIPLYWLSDSYRLAAEVEAYREQAKHYTVDKTWVFAEFIASRYSLDISKEAAHQLLTGRRE